ncbi:LolA family protein [Candidatus Contubernalis alkaliaceticus]|uniref:LolA family protein n=1 Tax=Candidatus Contubernalis alkaliaceticus TaxID=338645 RepID=UPI001F4BF48E|nr:DUF4412 domain-containing protein [Candidatus Contubernalis alkalaceticus]UNC91028.1 DUF2092 domain-containing protein [Candidatus Contubernalis alkalaceticus]
MKSMKRPIMIVLMLILVSIMVIGCGEKSQQEVGEDAVGKPEQSIGEDKQEANGTGDPETLEEIFNSMQDPAEVYYEMTMTGAGMENYFSKVWIKGEKVRTEGEMDWHKYIIIDDEDHYYTLDPEEKTALKMTHNWDDEMEEGFTADEFMEDMDLEGLEYLGKEKYNGVMCYVILDKDDYVTMKIWIHGDYGIPMKIESTGDDPEDHFTMEVKNLKVGGISDDLFVVPADYEIFEMNY